MSLRLDRNSFSYGIMVDRMGEGTRATEEWDGGGIVVLNEPLCDPACEAD